MSKPTTRQMLATLVPQGGIFLELGVAAGKYAESILEIRPDIHYCGIDRWSDHHDEAEMHNAKARLARFPNVEIIRASFADVVGDFADESIDLIYVDGYAHTGQDGGQTLKEWWPKVKPGGIFAGHDYSENYRETIEAVDAFLRQTIGENFRDHLNIIKEKPDESWWVIKNATRKP